ncbi:hypothetical protein A2U01_0118474, partial [Trifolium medium]|nr:hypothetical protein [Trifolium medium]
GGMRCAQHCDCCPVFVLLAARRAELLYLGLGVFWFLRCAARRLG